jgi:hypothetical protein
VHQVAAERLLAMKLSAWSDDTDIKDGRRALLEFANATLEEAWQQVERMCGAQSGKIAQAMPERDGLRLRALVLESLRSETRLSDLTEPVQATRPERAVLAGLLELLAERNGQAAPSWTGRVQNNEPLLAAAETMPRLRLLCGTLGPEPLRKQCLFARPIFLNSPERHLVKSGSRC